MHKNNIVRTTLLFLLVLTPMLLVAQSNYKQPMTIDAKGLVRDAGGKTIGMVTKDQIIKDANGQKLAFVDGQGNLVDARTGKKMGRMGKDGKTYYDAMGQLLFTVNDVDGPTCDIINAKGEKIGNVHDSLKGTACALHCFQSGHTHKH